MALDEREEALLLFVIDASSRGLYWLNVELLNETKRNGIIKNNYIILKFSDVKSRYSVLSQDSPETHFGCQVLVLWVGVLFLVLTSLSWASVKTV